MRQMVAVVFAVLLALPAPVLAQYPFGTWWNPEELVNFLLPGIAQEHPDWLRGVNLVYYVFVPFLTAWTVIYGILTQLNLFPYRDRLNATIAFAFAFLLLPSGILTLIVSYLYAAGAFTALVTFGVLLIGGTLLWAYGSGHKLWSTHVPLHIQQKRRVRDQIKEIDREIERLKDERTMARVRGDQKSVDKINERLDRLETKELEFRDKIIGLGQESAER